MQNKVAKAVSAILGVGTTTVAFMSKAFAQIDYSYSTSSSGDVGAAYYIIYCCCSLISLALWSGVSYWIYTDAKKNNVQNPALWAILTFFFGLIVILIYFLAIRNKNK